MAGKLAKYAKQNRQLRSQVRELNGTVGELEARHNPTVFRNFLGTGIKDGVAYGFTRLYVMLQQKGWAPKTVPLDVITGVAVQSTTAFFDGPVSSFFRDVGDGMAEGGFGRLATMHQLQQSEIAGTVCLIPPGAAAANGGGNPNAGNGG